jgi:glycerate kinase
MRVVFAPDAFSGTLTAGQVAMAMAEGWSAAAPADDLVLMPLSDGGPGFLDALAWSLPNARTLSVTAEDPFHRPVPTAVLVDDGETAYVEAATACGRHLVRPDERDLTVTSTYGVGQLLAAALDTGARHVVVGLGASATHDAGAGLLSALGVGRAEVLARGGLALAAVETEDLAPLPTVIAATRQRADLVVATDAETPLLGLQGATAVDAAAGGADTDQEALLETAFSHFAERVRRVVPGPLDLLTGEPTRVDRLPGAGAAGGLGYALYLLGGRRVGGTEAVAQAVGLEAEALGADLLVTGEGCFDWRSLHGAVTSTVAATGLAVGTPVVAIVGQSTVGRREAMGLGLSGVYPVAETSAQVQRAMADPAGTLASRTARVARTWSPYR